MIEETLDNTRNSQTGDTNAQHQNKFARCRILIIKFDTTQVKDTDDKSSL